jgi:hypothetical protein
VRSVDGVPRVLAQRSAPPADQPPLVDAARTGNHYQPSERVGRLPAIGLDAGAIPGTRPDRIRW